MKEYFLVNICKDENGKDEVESSVFKGIYHIKFKFFFISDKGFYSVII